MSRYIYDYSHVGSGRTSKRCASCDKEISKGKSSITITYHDCEFSTVSVCSVKCKDKYYEDFENDEEKDD